MKAKKQRTVVFAVSSDHHCGSTVALCPPSLRLDDGGEYHASKAQRWLHEGWLAYLARVAAVRDDEDADLYMGFNGDFTEGNHHGTTQILSGNPNAQAAVVDAVMRPVLDLKPDKMFFVRGTEAHVGQSGSVEERIASGLRKDKRPVVGDERGNASHWHLKMDIQGVRFDLAHHGRVGTRPWTKPNVTANLAAEIFYAHAASGQAHPHLAIRSHMHQWVDTHDQHPVRVIQLPAWQLATSFIHRIDTSGKLADIGGIICVIRNGELSVEKVKLTPDPVPTWRV
jgi:hypothetical protein